MIAAIRSSPHLAAHVAGLSRSWSKRTPAGTALCGHKHGTVVVYIVVITINHTKYAHGAGRLAWSLLQLARLSNRAVVSSCFLPNKHSAASRRQSSTTMLAALLILGAVASAQKDDFGFGGGAPRRPPPPSNADKPKPLWFVPSGPATKENCNAEGEAVLSGAKEVFESPTSEIFVPEGSGTDICIFFAPPQPQVWQLGTGVSYNSKSCSEGCCFYTPASSSRVQEIEAEVEKNLPTWFRTPAGGCDAVPKTTFNSRLVLNKDNNVSSAQLLHIFLTHLNQTSILPFKILQNLVMNYTS